MKVTWESVNALAALLSRCQTRLHPVRHGSSLQVGPDIYISCGDLGSTNEYVSTVASSTINTDRVLAGVGSRGIERDLSSLVAVWGICLPSVLIPALLKTLRDLSNGKRRKSKRKESGLTQHVGD